jgi:hypothetical protein
MRGGLAAIRNRLGTAIAIRLSSDQWIFVFNFSLVRWSIGALLDDDDPALGRGPRS